MRNPRGGGHRQAYLGLPRQQTAGIIEELMHAYASSLEGKRERKKDVLSFLP